MKIAHLILAHNNPQQLARLVDRLNHPDADIYIHLDAKAEAGDFEAIFKTPNVYLIPKRVKVYWGSYSIVQATVNGFAHILTAKKNYAYINLLSGNDYPIRSAQKIHGFFEANPDGIFMEYLTEESDWWQNNKTRITQYHLNDFKFPGVFNVQALMNKLLPARTLPKPLVVAGRSQWLTLSAASALYVVNYLDNHPKIRQFFRLTWGADEVAIQTILYNSPFRDKIVNNNYRYIDWSENKASPKTLTMADADKLMRSPALYARKFDLATEPDILNYLDSTF